MQRNARCEAYEDKRLRMCSSPKPWMTSQPQSKGHILTNKRIGEGLRILSQSNCRAKELRGKLGKAAYLEDWITKITSLTASDSTFNVTFDWDEEIGIPGAFIIKNYHHSEFYLKTLTLEDVPGHGQIHFVCNSWVYPAEYYKKDRVFFTNQTYLPSETPAPLCCYRKEELVNLRGDGTGKLEEWDRVYDYACYNDLGNDRPILGGSTKYPYPRRGRTGRPPAEKDPRYESRLPLLKSTNIYVPRDEKFSHLKMSDVIAYGLRSVFQFLLPEFEAQFDKTPSEFDKLDDILELYEGGIKLPNSHLLESIRREIPSETLRELLRSDGQGTFKFPTPQVIKGTIWLLAKAYVAVNDSGYHQLICHWLNTHAAIEPFVIATNRQLSVLHPIYKLLHPHFRDTMNINALARQALINAGGLLEMTVFHKNMPWKCQLSLIRIGFSRSKHSLLISSRGKSSHVNHIDTFEFN
ncbi:hypothetical protein F0562_029351 [Nyssa sinensis]|uniref:Lipoxygenase n=1 Tax=Nyssa sinensis TaxID=561372 RepID=A0A5J5B0U9_9ASTE|nr:hypothetical protein F0562_029351 [Nyssa sinensis]